MVVFNEKIHLHLFDVGIVQVNYQEDLLLVVSVLVINQDALKDPPQEVTRHELIRMVRAGMRVYLVSEIVAGMFSPLTNVTLETVNGLEYLKTSNEHGPFDDLG